MNLLKGASLLALAKSINLIDSLELFTMDCNNSWVAYVLGVLYSSCFKPTSDWSIDWFNCHCKCKSETWLNKSTVCFT